MHKFSIYPALWELGTYVRGKAIYMNTKQKIRHEIFSCGSVYGIFHWHIYTSFWVQTKVHTWRPKYFCANFRTSQKLGPEPIVPPTILPLLAARQLGQLWANKLNMESILERPCIPPPKVNSLILCCFSNSLSTELQKFFWRSRYKVKKTRKHTELNSIPLPPLSVHGGFDVNWGFECMQFAWYSKNCQFPHKRLFWP